VQEEEPEGLTLQQLVRFVSDRQRITPNKARILFRRARRGGFIEPYLADGQLYYKLTDKGRKAYGSII
jgi:hypothetical protein